MTIHQWFIPSRKNRFHPIALRPIGLVIFLAIFISIPLLYNVTSSQQFEVLGYAINVNVGDLFTASNQQRTNAGLGPLTLNSSLNSAALAKANNMISENYWAHVAPDGTTPWAFISAAGYQYTAAGENLAKDFSLSSGVVAGWMASPLHRDNILNSSYKDVGYAVVNGVLHGSETTLVVAMYGAKSEPVVAAVPPVQVQTTPQPVAQTQTAPTETIESAPIAKTDTVKPVVTNSTKQPITGTPVAVITDINSSEKPKSLASPNGENGLVEGLETSLPVRTYNSLNWGQKASILLLCTLILLFIMKHTLIWREQKRGVKVIWLRAHPIGQLAILSTVMIITIFSGVGVVL